MRGEPVDHSSDIFSLGTILYEMLSGDRPFRGASPVETMNAILFSIARIALTPDGKSYAYAYYRNLSDLYVVEGLK